MDAVYIAETNYSSVTDREAIYHINRHADNPGNISFCYYVQAGRSKPVKKHLIKVLHTWFKAMTPGQRVDTVLGSPLVTEYLSGYKIYKVARDEAALIKTLVKM